MKKIILPIATLAGTIIGVGLFSLPYAASKVGLPIMIGWFVLLGILVIIVHLFYAEVALNTPDFKRFPGFVSYHLGKRWQKLAYITTVGGLLGAILAYLIIGGEFLTQICQPIFGGGGLRYGIIYFLVGSLVILAGLRMVSQIELIGLVLFFLILIGIFIRGLPYFKIDNLFPQPDLSKIFLPYGLILFSLWGAALIPEIEEMLRGHKELFKKVILISFLIPLLVYLFFIITILGITGKQTTPSALPGLKSFLGDGIVTLTLIFGLITTFTSFISLGMTLKKVLIFDFKISPLKSWLITCFLPFFVYFLGFKNLVSLLSFLGGVFLGIDGILMLLMYKKIKPEKKNLVYFLSLIFVLGIIYELIYSFR